jgi:hypothetical protein
MTDKVTAVLVTREKEWPADIEMNFPFDDVLVQTESPNLLPRFDLAKQARNEIIYVQDDDAQIDIRRLWRHYDERVTNAITHGHLRIYNELCGNRVTLIGWGCFFPKRLIDFQPWHDWYGDLDPIEIDRIFTHLAYRYQEAPHNSVVMPIEQLERPRAISRDNPRHYHDRAEIIRKLEAML